MHKICTKNIQMEYSYNFFTALTIYLVLKWNKTSESEE